MKIIVSNAHNVTNQSISFEEFDKIILKLGIFYHDCKIAVAVSGGSDSLCLIFLAKKWAEKYNYKIIALIVNHKLRLDSDLESSKVSSYLNSKNIDNIVLTREDIKLNNKIQEKAREDRYNLLLDYCYNNSISYLLVAHHLDDQLETMIFREDKGENQLGLSGMSAKIINPKAIILRPLLNYPKQMLLNTLKQFGDFWVEDPSNINDKYARVRIRKYLYNIEYIKKNQLINKLYDNQKNRIQLESNLLSAIYESVKINAIGLIKINLILFNSYEKNVKMLMLRYLLKYASGDKHPVEIVKIDNLLQKIAGKIKVSLGGCIISIQKNYIKIFKEPNAVCDKMINFLNKKLWDGRFLSDNSNYYSLQKEDLIKILKNKEYKEFLKKYDINMVDIFSLPYIYHNKEISLNKDEKYNYFIVQSLLMSRFVAI